jgi:hypothetical protein
VAEIPSNISLSEKVAACGKFAQFLGNSEKMPEIPTADSTGILRKSSGFGVFAEIFSKNIVIPSKEIPFFGEAHQRFWAIIAKFGFFGVLRMARIAKFGYSGDPNNRITEYSVIRVTRTTE